MKILCLFAALVLVGAASAQKPPAGSKSSGSAQQATQQVSDAKLKALEAGYKSAKADFAKKPKDAKVKQAYINATFAVGMGRMYSVSLSPHERYSTALSAFREVKKVDPKHKEANKNYDLIVSIYHSMKRPVPGEH